MKRYGELASSLELEQEVQDLRLHRDVERRTRPRRTRGARGRRRERARCTRVASGRPRARAGSDGRAPRRARPCASSSRTRRSRSGAVEPLVELERLADGVPNRAARAQARVGILEDHLELARERASRARRKRLERAFRERRCGRRSVARGRRWRARASTCRSRIRPTSASVSPARARGSRRPRRAPARRATGSARGGSRRRAAESSREPFRRQHAAPALESAKRARAPAPPRGRRRARSGSAARRCTRVNGPRSRRGGTPRMLSSSGALALVDARQAPQQRLRVRMERRAEELARRRAFDDAPRVHHEHAVAGARDDAEVVRDEDDRESRARAGARARAPGSAPGSSRRARSSARRR